MTSYPFFNFTANLGESQRNEPCMLSVGVEHESILSLTEASAKRTEISKFGEQQH